MPTAHKFAGSPARSLTSLLPPLLVATVIALWALFGPDLLPVPLPPLRTGVLDRIGPGLLLVARDEGFADTTRVRINELAAYEDLAAGLRDGTFDVATLSLEDALRVVDSGNDIAVLAVMDRPRDEGSTATPKSPGSPGSPGSWDLLVVRRALLVGRPDDVRALSEAWFAAVRALEQDRARSMARLAVSLGQSPEILGPDLDAIEVLGEEEQAALLHASPLGLLDAAQKVTGRLVRERRLHGDDCARRLLGLASSATKAHAAGEPAR